jgi:hypothetical protein
MTISQQRVVPYVGAASLMLLLAVALHAGETHIWTQSDYGDFERGVLQNLSLRSDGLLTLAPRSHELFDTGTAYLWALAQDSKGVLYAGGGTSAKLFRIPPGGPGKVAAEFDALEIHALAIDSRDRVYAATSPDGKVYRITGNAKPEVFYDPKAKYIWALAFNHKGDLLVATGGISSGSGEIHSVPPDGKGKVFFHSDETHVRSMAVAADDSIVIGTDPGGLVLRISQTGEGFVLFQMPKKEVTAVAVARDGGIYASAAGNKQATPSSAPSPVSPPPPASTGITVSVNQPGSAAGPAPQRAAAPPPPPPGAAGVAGGSEVYRIDPNGNPRRVWSSTQDTVYAIAFDGSGRVVLGTGNRGNIYRVESPRLITTLLTVPATQVTVFLPGPGGRIWAASSNTGKIYEFGPELEREGSVESDVFDAGMFTLWGRLSFEAKLNGGRISIVARSGNLDQPQKNWSSWSPAITSTDGARIVSPPSRFIQWKATLSAGGAASPELESVDVAYLPKNIEPSVDEIEITPPNYKFPAPTSTTPVTTNGLSATLSLPTLGRRPTASASTPENTTSTPTMQLARGYIGARWLAADPNGDTLIYKVEIRGTAETEWKLLKDRLTEKYLSWDSTAFPDGEYRLRVTASDSPSNPPAEALTTQTESDPFFIDNTPPKVTGLTATRAAGKLQVRWHAADALNDVAKAEYSLDGGDWTVASPVTKLSDSKELDYDLTIDVPAGEHTIAVRVTDDYDNQAVEKAVVK